MNRNILRYLIVSMKGMAMGAADVVPGVSGGTIAFISGIYEELIESIKSLNVQALRVLFNRGIPSFWKHINGTFLFSLVAGILISVISLARLLEHLLVNHPVLIWSFFLLLQDRMFEILYILLGIDRSTHDGITIWRIIG